jgi:cell division septation protein DedD
MKICGTCSTPLDNTKKFCTTCGLPNKSYGQTFPDSSPKQEEQTIEMEPEESRLEKNADERKKQEHEQKEFPIQQLQEEKGNGSEVESELNKRQELGQLENEAIDRQGQEEGKEQLHIQLTGEEKESELAGQNELNRQLELESVELLETEASEIKRQEEEQLHIQQLWEENERELAIQNEINRQQEIRAEVLATEAAERKNQEEKEERYRLQQESEGEDAESEVFGKAEEIISMQDDLFVETDDVRQPNGSPTHNSKERWRFDKKMRYAVMLTSIAILSTGIYYSVHYLQKDKTPQEMVVRTRESSKTELLPKEDKTLTSEMVEAKIQGGKSKERGIVLNSRLSTPCWLIGYAAVPSESDAIKFQVEMQKNGYKTGYFWIPDYIPAGKKLYRVYVGPFLHQDEANKALEGVKQYKRDAYMSHLD